MNEISLPIDHLSYSSIRLFCSNQQQFFKNYILGIWDFKQSVTSLIGKAGHKALEHYYKTGDFEKGVEMGLAFIEKTKDSEVDFGKTGSREQVIREFTKAINFYRNEEPDLGEVKEVEFKITTDKGLDNDILPVPIKAVTDIVSEKDKKIMLWDYKFVASFTNKEEEQPDYIMQGLFNFITVRAKFGRDPYSITYLEIKKSENKDHSPQIQPYEIVFDKFPEYKKYLYKLYGEVIIELANPNKKYLPNFSDNYNGKEAFTDFIADTINFEKLPKHTHKADLTKMRSVEYVESKLENETNLTDEEKIRLKLQEFGVAVAMDKTYKGHNVTLYTMKPSRGIKMAQLTSYAPDLSLALKAKSVRIQAPIPETDLVGVEVSNKVQDIVEWNEDLVKKGTLQIPVGMDVYGNTKYLDLTKAPHLMIGGTTGSGKSVFMNVIIKTLTHSMDRENLELILIDPKRTEFLNYENLPQLVDKVITENNEAEATLRFAVEIMEQRYKLLEKARVKNIDEYNSKQAKNLPYMVIVIDELADLMLEASSRNSVENSIVRLAQKARAAGIHLVVATQRPSVDVLTGLIKANFSTRVSFMVSTGTDSRVILDDAGAEKLIGNGDLLFMNPREQGLQRLQGFFIK